MGDGDIVTGQRVGSRVIELTMKARRASLNDKARRRVTQYFRAGSTYKLYVNREEGARYGADCLLDGLQIPPENIYVPMSAKISMLMPEGYWLSVENFGQNIASITPRCGYPFIAYKPASIPAGNPDGILYGRIYGVYNFANTVELDNDGDAKAFCRVVFNARGTVTNPKLTAGNGYVRVLCTLGEGDELVIDGRTKSVTINGQNAATKVDKTSSFEGIVFGIGTNTIGYSADVGSNVLDVNVYYGGTGILHRQ